MKQMKKILTFLITTVLVLGLSVTPISAEESYTVQSGDMLWKIAKDHDTTWEDLASMNDLDNPSLIFPGQKLMLTASDIVAEPSTIVSEVVNVPSRGIEIPGVFTYPTEGSDFPLVVMAHGHGGSKDEAGGFVQAAEILAENGVASIRVDFPGCGDSNESFFSNTVTAMLLDIDASLDFALASGKVDQSKVSIYGYSMGGRLAMLSAANNPIYNSVALWAPAATNGSSSMYTFMGGQEAFEAFDAMAQENGYYLFTTIWGQEQLLSKQFFDDMNGSTPIDDVADYAGPVLIVNGSTDIIIDTTIIAAAMAAFTSSTDVTNYTVTGADHGFGLYSGEPELTSEALKVTTDFLVKHSK